MKIKCLCSFFHPSPSLECRAAVDLEHENLNCKDLEQGFSTGESRNLLLGRPKMTYTRVAKFCFAIKVGRQLLNVESR